MKLQRPLIGFALLTLLYLGTLIWIDSSKQVFAQLPRLWSALSVMIALTLLTYVVRFARWQWLLHRLGHRPPMLQSLLAYVAGFAFSATPGKVGELIRIRYLQPLGVPAPHTLGAFVCERLLDLLSVLPLAALYLREPRLLMLAFVFTGTLTAMMLLVLNHPGLLRRLIAWLRTHHAPRAAKLLGKIKEGLQGSRSLLTPANLLIGLGAGIAAWLVSALAFAWLLAQLGLAMPASVAIPMYPLAMLVGAASMIPGGLGSTEATLTTLLLAEGAPLQAAALAVIGIRLAFLWFSIAVGFVAFGVLEWRGASSSERRQSP
ncbi:MAG: lysylphosphatidylglycerol synthase transmembrane domain-containing protein [Lautropia sp.]|nr:lysylphosphatidylglycerol synthase transmembrane domain-containing protein [Lautropia sp.]